VSRGRCWWHTFFFYVSLCIIVVCVACLVVIVRTSCRKFHRSRLPPARRSPRRVLSGSRPPPASSHHALSHSRPSSVRVAPSPSCPPPLCTPDMRCCCARHSARHAPPQPVAPGVPFRVLLLRMPLVSLCAHPPVTLTTGRESSWTLEGRKIQWQNVQCKCYF
jgi:hypothetical protein